MDFKKLKTVTNKFINGPTLITPKLHSDKRGAFYESWNKSEFNRLIGKEVQFIQDNVSSSKKGVIRGLHYQVYPNIQSKLISCSKGAIFDVAIDLRKKSSTFGLYCYAYLNPKNNNQFWIPDGFAHGFLALFDNTEVRYKVQGLRDINSERSLKWDDHELDIKWPITENNINEIILSNKDSNAPNFNEVIKSGDYFN